MARRLLAPDGAVRQTEVRSPSGVVRRYDSSSGYVTVSDGDARALLAEGYTEAAAGGQPSTAKGRRCPACGFHAYFTTCGRCGADTTQQSPEPTEE